MKVLPARPLAALTQAVRDTYSPWTDSPHPASIFPVWRRMAESTFYDDSASACGRGATNLGFSQEELAARAELDRTYIGGVERGERNVGLINIHRIAKALDLAPKDLL